MSNFTLTSSETKPLTKAVVNEFKEMEASPTERSLDLKRVKHLREKADSGLLTPFSWSCAIIDGKKVRMNGQHSSTMLSEMNGEFPDGLQVHMDTYEADSLDALALLFRQFDDRKSSRTTADVSGAYQGLYPELADVSTHSAKISIEGVTWFRRTIEGAPVESGDDIYRVFRQTGLHGFIHYVGKTLSTKTREIKKVSVIAAMYATFAANETVSREFWDHVARGGVEYEDEHPASVLAGWLLSAYQKEMKVPPKAAEYYNACIYAWNAHREGKTLSKINIAKLKGNLDAEA